MKSTLIKKAFIASLPVMAGYVVLGFGFGVLAVSQGISLPWALLMSLFIYAGSMQYAAVGLLAARSGFLTLALTTLLVNARHVFYGISMIDRYRNTGIKKLYLMFGLTDETYSLVCTDHPELSREEYPDFCLLVSGMNQCYWVCGSLLGAAAGTLIRFNSAGIDFSLTALFLTIVVDQWKNARDHRPALLGGALSLLSLLLFGPDSFLIPSMLGILLSLLLFRRKMEAQGG